MFAFVNSSLSNGAGSPPFASQLSLFRSQFSCSQIVFAPAVCALEPNVNTVPTLAGGCFKFFVFLGQFAVPENTFWDPTSNLSTSRQQRLYSDAMHAAIHAILRRLGSTDSYGWGCQAAVWAQKTGNWETKRAFHERQTNRKTGAENRQPYTTSILCPLIPAARKIGFNEKQQNARFNMIDTQNLCQMTLYGTNTESPLTLAPACGMCPSHSWQVNTLI